MTLKLLGFISAILTVVMAILFFFQPWAGPPLALFGCATLVLRLLYYFSWKKRKG